MPTVIAMRDFGDPNMKQKALYPAVDASMITQMKRRSAIIGDLVSHPTGRKGTGAVVDGQNIRGFTNSSIRSTFLTRGSGLTFFRVL